MGPRARRFAEQLCARVEHDMRCFLHPMSTPLTRQEAGQPMTIMRPPLLPPGELALQAKAVAALKTPVAFKAPFTRQET